MSESASDALHNRLVASGAILKLELSQHYAARNWKPAIGALLDRLRAGQTLEKMPDDPKWNAPVQLKALLVESLKVGDPAQLVLDVCRQQEENRRLWRGLYASFLYPGVLLLFSFAVSLMVSFVFADSRDMMGIESFGLRGMEWAIAMRKDQFNSHIGLAMVLGWSIAILVVVTLLGPKWSLVAIVGGLPLIGGPFRWLCLSELLGRVELFTRQGMTHLDAIGAAAKTFRGTGLAVVAHAVGLRVTEGVHFGQALKQSTLSDGLCRPALGLLDAPGQSSHERLRGVSALLHLMAEKHCRALVFVLPAIMFLAVGSIIGNLLNSYIAFFMPLVRMISSLM